MSTELTYLTLTALLTAVLWVPYIVVLIRQLGLVPALMDGQHEFTLEPAWARRAQRAHTNAVENLAVFAALIAAVELAGANSALTAGAAALFFWLRVGHAMVYLAGAPVIRTVLFAGAFGCQVAIGLALLGLL